MTAHPGTWFIACGSAVALGFPLGIVWGLSSPSIEPTGTIAPWPTPVVTVTATAPSVVVTRTQTPALPRAEQSRGPLPRASARGDRTSGDPLRTRSPRPLTTDHLKRNGKPKKAKPPKPHRRPSASPSPSTATPTPEPSPERSPT